MTSPLKLNERAALLCDAIAREADALRVSSCFSDSGLEIWDFGIQSPGGLEAGRQMAKVCLAGLAEVDFVPGDPNVWPGPAVQVRSDQPIAACMASHAHGVPVLLACLSAAASRKLVAAIGDGGMVRWAVLLLVLLRSFWLPPSVLAILKTDCVLKTKSLFLSTLGVLATQASQLVPPFAH